MTIKRGIKISTRLIFLAIITSTIIAFIGLMGVNNLSKVNAGTVTMYSDRIVRLKQLKAIADGWAVSVVDASHKARNGNWAWCDALASMETAHTTMRRNLATYGSTHMKGEELKLWNELRSMDSLSAGILREILSILHQGENPDSKAKLDELVINKLYRSIDPISVKVSELIDLQLSLAKQISDESNELYHHTRKYSYTLIVVAILLSLLVSYLITSKETKFEKQLIKSNHEKDILLKEVHHRVKNNLQIITGLLEINSSDGVSNNSTAINRIKSISKVHDLLYKNPSLGKINIKEYINNFLREFYIYYPDIHIAFNFQAAPCFVSIEKAVPLGIILNEIVTNIYKHAFSSKPQGKIIIQLSEKAGTVDFQISDNGKGLPEDFNIATSNTMGFVLIASLSKQIHGTLRIQSHLGTSVHLSFKNT